MKNDIKIYQGTNIIKVMTTEAKQWIFDNFYQKPIKSNREYDLLYDFGMSKSSIAEFLYKLIRQSELVISIVRPSQDLSLKYQVKENGDLCSDTGGNGFREI